jgi:DNA repair protein RadC
MTRWTCRLVKEAGAIYAGEAMRGPESVARIMTEHYGDLPQEAFVAFLLDARHRIRGYTEVTRGTASECLIDASVVFRAAILANSTAILLAHNHPSGDPTPSREDYACTKQLVEAGKVLGIAVMDHVVCGDDGRYTSIAEQGRMDG